MRKHRTWQIFCGECGYEIWSELDEHVRDSLTLAAIERAAICSDCITDQFIERGSDREIPVSEDIKSDKLT